MQYYYSVNNIPQIIGCSKFLLSKNSLEREYIETILQVVWNIHDYELSVIVHKYVMKNRIILTNKMDKLIRSRILEKLRDSLVMYKNV